MASPVKHSHLRADQISIFRNVSERGDFLSANLNGRRYKDEGSDEWHSSHSYTVDQLAHHICNCQRVLTWMMDNDPNAQETSTS